MRHEKTTSPIVARQFHATVDGNKPAVVGFFMTWGNKVSPTFLWADLRNCPSWVVLWEPVFFGKPVRVVASLGQKFDSRGTVLQAWIYREDGADFSTAFRVHYIH